MLYLDLTSSGGGRVVGYFEAKPAWTGRNTEGTWLDVADSFAGYLEALVEESPEGG
ncbi:hypothetical protein [Enhygromyxa salina]|uniref:hypothetical protein n=1 Tax=Enhygromyxa salina TaxID=215803 RepID=UPI0015E62BA2|nr:hypothetical protein [Enhygromyxa salina]